MYVSPVPRLGPLCTFYLLHSPIRLAVLGFQHHSNTPSRDGKIVQAPLPFATILNPVRDTGSEIVQISVWDVPAPMVSIRVYTVLELPQERKKKPPPVWIKAKVSASEKWARAG